MYTVYTVYSRLGLAGWRALVWLARCGLGSGLARVGLGSNWAWLGLGLARVGLGSGWAWLELGLARVGLARVGFGWLGLICLLMTAFLGQHFQDSASVGRNGCARSAQPSALVEY